MMIEKESASFMRVCIISHSLLKSLSYFLSFYKYCRCTRSRAEPAPALAIPHL